MRQGARMLRHLGLMLAFVLAVVLVELRQFGPAMALAGLCIGGVWLEGRE